MVRFCELYAGPSRNGVYKSKDHHGRGVRIVNMGELFQYDLIGAQEMNRLEMTESEMEKDGLLEGDLLFGRRSLIEAGAGKCSLVKELTEPATFESSIIRVRVDQTLVNPLFLFYWFRSGVGGGAIRAIVTGTNVKGVRASLLGTIPVAHPDRKIQDRCADILHGYDDLIENNRRRIQLLENVARLLFQEWFVYMRFPGHEHSEIINGLPEGWNRPALELVCIDNEGIQTGPFGSQLHQSDYSEAGVPVVMPKNLISFRIALEGIARIPDLLAHKLSRHRMADGDTVYGRRGDIGRRAFISAKQVGWLCGTGCLRIRPNPEKVSPRFLFDALGAPDTAGAIANRAKGSTMPNLNATLLKSVGASNGKRIPLRA
jgi:type I restriction enzyme S subunit